MKNKSICIVTEEWPGIPGCGGIGTAFFELSTLLARNNWKVEILFVPIEGTEPQEFEALEDIVFHLLDLNRYAYPPHSYEKKATLYLNGYSIGKYLLTRCIFLITKVLDTHQPA